MRVDQIKKVLLHVEELASIYGRIKGFDYCDSFLACENCLDLTFYSNGETDFYSIPLIDLELTPEQFKDKYTAIHKAEKEKMEAIIAAAKKETEELNKLRELQLLAELKEKYPDER